MSPPANINEVWTRNARSMGSFPFHFMTFYLGTNNDIRNNYHMVLNQSSYKIESHTQILIGLYLRKGKLNRKFNDRAKNTNFRFSVQAIYMITRKCHFVASYFSDIYNF